MSDATGGGQPPHKTQEQIGQQAERVQTQLAGFDDGTDPFAAAVRVTRMPMIITNPRKADNPIVFANDAFCHLTGYAREEILGRNCRFLQGPDSDPVTVTRMRMALAALEPIELDIRNYRKNGEPFWNRLLMVPVHDANGSLSHFFASQFDVTMERERLAELESHNAALTALGDQLAARTDELTDANGKLRAEARGREQVEEALRQAQKMEAVGQLTGGIAHDFNNLLGGIMGSLELLQRRLSAARVEGMERYTSAAITSAQRAAALTQRLLAFARRQPLDPKRIEANRLLAGMEDLLRRTLGPGVALEMVFAGGLWVTLCDPNQLESAVLNLAINARDAMPEGGSLTIETANVHLDDAYARDRGGEVRPGQYVAISVSDTGTGMTPEVVAKAFDPFFSTKPTGHGTGLGLSMLYGFVKQSEGNVRIYSELGQGTTFKVYLPRHRGEAEVETAAEAGGAGSAPRAEAGETVLVVEDEATIRMLVTETLGDLGYTAIEAADGPSGLQVLQSDIRIDLLVTDVGLPGMNGRQLADAARVLRPGLRVLFMTGYAHNAAVGVGAPLDPGMEILTKPFTLDALATKIRDMIEDVSAARQPQPPPARPA